MNNKKLIEKYPWLQIRNVWTGELVKPEDYEFTWLDDLPDGWRKAFGLQMVKELDKICPGIYGENTLLYGLEAKFSSNKVDIDKYGKTSIDNIYCIGDCSGMCRGLTTASSMGIMCAINILNKF